MKRYQSLLLWITALIITLSSAVYQRLTGPNHPLKGQVTVNATTYKFSLLRSYNTGNDAEIQLSIPDHLITGKLSYRRYRSHDDWSTVPLVREQDDLLGYLPQQPSAGKVMYTISLVGAASTETMLTDIPVILRYNDAVPGFILLPHVLIMFTAMLISNRSGLQALTRGGNLFNYALWTTGLLLVGGLILGPIVQKYAFGAYWTGWPFGNDLTDNKTIVAFIAWVLAVWKNKDRVGNRGWVLAASIVLFLVYMIPHSMLGSELDYTTMEQ